MLVFLEMLEGEEEKSVFLEIYETYRYFLWFLAHEILKDEYLAEDAVQETFFSIIKYIEKIKDIKSVRTKNFLATIVRNKAIDILRRQKGMVMEELEESDHSQSQDMLDTYLQKEKMEQIVKAIENLNESYRIVLEYRYLHGLSEEETARMVGISPKNANVRIFRARKKLQEILIKEGVYEC
ncbi:MAG: RNA polymerase sigma factor [Lachnospiraceae bacterium]|nr:RNA polymerase sigma factor [Lachnospiraceae bacterium]